MYEMVDQCSNEVLANTSEPGQKTISNEIKLLHDQFIDLRSVTSDAKEKLDYCVHGLHQYTTEYELFNEWLKNAEETFEMHNSKCDTTNTDNQVEQLEVRKYIYI